MIFQKDERYYMLSTSQSCLWYELKAKAFHNLLRVAAFSYTYYILLFSANV